MDYNDLVTCISYQVVTACNPPAFRIFTAPLTNYEVSQDNQFNPAIRAVPFAIKYYFNRHETRLAKCGIA